MAREHPKAILRRYNRPGLFITATGTDVGKTTVTAALAGALHQSGVRVGIIKPVASGNQKDPGRLNEDRMSVDEDFLPADCLVTGRMAGLNVEDRELLNYMSPVRYAAPVSPHVAARIEGRQPDWRKIAGAIDFWEENCDALLVEGSGGWLVPLDEHDFTVADLAAALKLPVLVVTTAELGTLNDTMLTVQNIRSRNLPVVGLVINQVPEHRGLAEETNIEELPRLCGVPVRAVLPRLVGAEGADVPRAFVEALKGFAEEWWRVSKGEE